MLRLHDTASGRVADFVPRDVGSVTLYVCGPTVYGAPHVGHGRFALVYDVLRRFLAFQGNVVHHVSNVTDIDDKIIDRANAEGRSWREVAEECEAEWWAAMDAMGLLRPDPVPHASEYLDGMIELVGDLVSANRAYETSDGVYLDVTSVEDYGLLKHQDLESLLAGARVDVLEEKRSPGDFALWKRAKPNEPSWASPFGDGRPGWHTECVVMSLALLGEGFDLHGGGQDLIFPHHENERAQAVALGRRFARHWIHNGLVTVGGEKMSKSLGNFTTLADLLSSTDPRAYRLLVLRSSYRSPLEVNAVTLQDASSALARIDALARRLADAPAGNALDLATQERSQFTEAMEDDLDTPRALARLFEVLRRANAELDRGDHAAGTALGQVALELFAVLGIEVREVAVVAERAALELLEKRNAARQAGDFTKADVLRDELRSLGWVIEDGPGGSTLRRDG